jgi:hypothetical protein
MPEQLKSYLEEITLYEMYLSLVVFSKQIKSGVYKYVFFFKNKYIGEIVSDAFVLYEALEKELKLNHNIAVYIYQGCHLIELEEVLKKF